MSSEEGQRIRKPGLLEDKYEPEPNSGCWLWTAAKSDTGYGSYHDPILRRRKPAHRAVYEALVGSLGVLHIDHLCRNRACVNPKHLEPVTLAENNRRALQKEFCIRGHPIEQITKAGIRGCRTCRNEVCKRRYREGKFAKAKDWTA